MLMENEDNYLMMSGIQHFDYCRRQWALIHIEQQWKENMLTVEGSIVHKKCHDDSLTEKRNDIIIMRGMRVVSHKLQLSGTCDVVEFHKDENGIDLFGYSGRWKPIPIEYKHGSSKTIDADRLQLCAQSIALEEMLVCTIEYAYLYYKKTNRREKVLLTDDLREKVATLSEEMNHYFNKGWTPKVKRKTKCNNCSLKDLCMPELNNNKSVKSYITDYIKE